MTNYRDIHREGTMQFILDYTSPEDDDQYSCFCKASQSPPNAPPHPPAGDSQDYFIVTVKYILFEASVGQVVSLFRSTRTVPYREFYAFSAAVLLDMFSDMPWELPVDLLDSAAPGICSHVRQVTAQAGPTAGILPINVYVVGPYRRGGVEEVEFLEAAGEDNELEWALAESEGVRTVPASRAAIEALEEVKIERIGGIQTRARARAWEDCDNQCTICLEKLLRSTNSKKRVNCEDGLSKIVRLPCSHLFHKACIVEWLETSHLCPLCRHAMPTTSS